MTAPIDFLKPIEVFNTTARVIRPAIFLGRQRIASDYYEVLADNVRWTVGPDNTIIGPSDYARSSFPRIWIVRNRTH
jgi:hypothetical protein